MSADLVGATAFKDSFMGKDNAYAVTSDAGSAHLDHTPSDESPAQHSPELPGWVSVFEGFYRDFPAESAWQTKKYQPPRLPDHLKPTVVKVLGDELLLSVTVESVADVKTLVRFFRSLLHALILATRIIRG